MAYEEETQRAPLPAQPTYDFAERCRLPGASDNAAIAKDDVPAGTGIRHNTTTLRLRSTILEGHRFALVPIAEGELITSWGEPFGRALRAIAAGEWLRNANTLRVLRGRPQIADGVLDAATQPNFANYTKPQPELTEAGFVPGPQPPLDAARAARGFDGFARGGGRGVGTRNYAVLLCVSSRASVVARALERRMAAEAGGALDGVVLEPALEKRLGHVAAATKNTRANAAPFRHVLLHGPPGTGKTLFAKKLARASGLDYAILTGGDVAPLGRDAVTEIHRLFDWAATSRRGLLLFIDEADAFLRSRREATSEDLRNAFNAFLYRTGEPSRDVMLVYASNAAEDFDWAVNDRIDEMVRFSLPGRAERARMLRQYLDEYFGAGDIADAKLDGAVAATEGFSGREINKLVVAWKAAASVGAGGALDDATRAEVLDAHVEQRAVKSGWNALAAA